MFFWNPSLNNLPLEVSKGLIPFSLIHSLTVFLPSTRPVVVEVALRPNAGVRKNYNSSSLAAAVADLHSEDLLGGA